MKKISTGLILLAALVGSRSAFAANNTTVSIHGSGCTAIHQTAVLGYNQFGVNNPTSSPVWVTCPVQITSNVLFTSYFMQVTAYNRNTASNLTCTIAAQDVAGVNMSSSSVSFPFNNNSQFKTASLSFPNSRHFGSIFCQIPAKTAAGALSHLTSIVLTGSN
jgi:hypothetical protein